MEKINTTQRRTFVLSALAAALVPTKGLHAQDFPNRPITLVVPFAAGGVTDAVARAIAKPLGERLGQPVVVDNKPGAGGSVAADAVARARADGYTLLFGSRVTQITNPLVNKTRLPTEQDFAPISTVCDVDAIVVSHPGRPYKTVSELVTYARANPGKVNFATPGNGTAAHLAAAVFMDLTKTVMTHVAYKGSAPAVQDLLGGIVDIALVLLCHKRSRALMAAQCGQCPRAPASATLN